MIYEPDESATTEEQLRNLLILTNRQHEAITRYLEGLQHAQDARQAEQSSLTELVTLLRDQNTPADSLSDVQKQALADYSARRGALAGPDYRSEAFGSLTQKLSDSIRAVHEQDRKLRDHGWIARLVEREPSDARS